MCHDASNPSIREGANLWERDWMNKRRRDYGEITFVLQVILSALADLGRQ